MKAETIISRFLAVAYTDENLAALLAHAQDGNLSYWSCCCLAGIPTATHAMQSKNIDEGENEHWQGEYVAGGDRASSAFCRLASEDDQRRAKLIPLILAEMDRRASLITTQDNCELRDNDLNQRVVVYQSKSESPESEKVLV